MIPSAILQPVLRLLEQLENITATENNIATAKNTFFILF